MAYRGEIVRLEKYINNTQGNYIPKKTEELLPSMIRQMGYWIAETVNIESKTKQILSEGETQPFLNPWYLSFARKIMSLMHTHRGMQLQKETDTILNKWVAHGLNRDMLERIRNSIFTLSAPSL